MEQGYAGCFKGVGGVFFFSPGVVSDMMMMMMFKLVYSLPYQIAFGAVPLASIRRPLHIILPYQNNTKQVPLQTQEQISHTTPAIPMSLYLCCNTNTIYYYYHN